MSLTSCCQCVSDVMLLHACVWSPVSQTQSRLRVFTWRLLCKFKCTLKCRHPPPTPSPLSLSPTRLLVSCVIPKPDRQKMSVTSLRKHKKKTGRWRSNSRHFDKRGKKQHRCRKFLQLWCWWSSAVLPDVCLILSWRLIAAMTRPTGDWALIKILGKLCWKQRMDENRDWLPALPNKALRHKSLNHKGRTTLCELVRV